MAALVILLAIVVPLWRTPHAHARAPRMDAAKAGALAPAPSHESTLPARAATLTFANQHSVRLDVLWDDVHRAQEVALLEALEPGNERVVNSFEGHRFVWRRSDTKEKLGGLTSRAGEQRVLLNEQPELKGEASACSDRTSTSRCLQMRQQGHCTAAPGWMAVNCAATCDMCEMKSSAVRCALDRFNRTTAIPEEEGSLDRLFQRIVAEYAPDGLIVHSRPPTGPWVVTLENFVSDAEIEGLLVHTRANLARSTDQGATDLATGVTQKVVSSRRTSSNAWCLGPCETEPRVRELVAKIERLTGISSQHYEQFQVLRYEVGEEYMRHHDYAPRNGVPEPAGPRLLTVFLYFSDVQGGETTFTDLSPPVSVSPKRGRALLWPSVLSHDLHQQDTRTHHRAQPVIAGAKYAANAWVHVFDFRTPNLWGCTGAFED